VATTDLGIESQRAVYCGEPLTNISTLVSLNSVSRTNALFSTTTNDTELFRQDDLRDANIKGTFNSKPCTTLTTHPQTSAPTPPLISLLPTSKWTLCNTLWQKFDASAVLHSRFSKGHLQRMRRLVPMALLEPEKFREVAEDVFAWGPKTQSSYHQCVLSIKRDLGLGISTMDQHMGILLANQARASPTWDIEQEHAVLSTEGTRRLLQLAQTCSPTSPFAAAWLTYFLGQRMSDVMELTTDDIFLVSTDQWQYMSITFNKHKNSSKGKPPYSIALPVNSLAGQNMTRALATTQHGQGDPKRIFPLLTRSAERIVIEELKIDIRALRRSGLQNMARAGATLPELLGFSRHTTIAMLELYLFHGVMNIQTALRQVEITSKAEKIDPPTLQRL